MTKIFINAGHGGKDSGAVSKTGTHEADICLKVARHLKGYLENAGLKAVLYQQISSVNEVVKAEATSKADLFISIHCNSATSSSAHGTETLYLPTSSKSQMFALIVHKYLTKTVCLFDRGLKPRTDLAVLKYTKAPAILVELAFLSNPVEEKLLLEKPELFALGISKGIKEYLGLKKV